MVANVIGNTLYFNNVGLIGITARQGESGFYALGETTFSVSVNQIAPTLTSAPAIGNAGTIADISAYITTNNDISPISYVSGDTLIANVIGNTLYFYNYGNALITATQGESGN